MSDQARFQWPVRVYWEDTDAGGIVFYANYLKYFERARTEWLRSLGVGQNALKESTGGMFVVSETSLRYLRPARLDDQLIVTTRVLEQGRASLVLVQQALLFSEQATPVPQGLVAENEKNLRPETMPILCEGQIQIGWVVAQTLQPARIPANIMKALQ